MADNDNKPETPPIDEIYRQLRKGLGHEHVTLANVDELLKMAEADGQQVLAEELREYRNDC